MRRSGDAQRPEIEIMHFLRVRVAGATWDGILISWTGGKAKACFLSRLGTLDMPGIKCIVCTAPYVFTGSLQYMYLGSLHASLGICSLDGMEGE